MTTIKTVGQLRKMINGLDDNFAIQFGVRRRLSEEELKNMPYPWPFDTEYFEGFKFDDIGWSDRVLCISVTSGESNL